MAEIVLSSDTLNEGRIKINQVLTGTAFVWTSSAITTTIQNTSAAHTVGGTFGLVFGKSHTFSTGSYGVIAGGTGNTISSTLDLLVMEEIIQHKMQVQQL